MSLEPRIGPHGRDDDLTRALRAMYAAPADDAYWTALASRIMARLSGDAADAWWQPLARWARFGLIAAAVALVAAHLAVSRNAARDETPIAYDGALEASQNVSLQLATDGSTSSTRDATLQYVISP